MKIFIFILTLTLSINANQGRLDKDGGHTDSATSNYHYHTARKGTNINPFHSPIRIQILKYGYPDSWGQEFSSIERCNAKKKRLTEINKGSDYSYVCAIK